MAEDAEIKDQDSIIEATPAAPSKIRELAEEGLPLRVDLGGILLVAGVEVFEVTGVAAIEK